MKTKILVLLIALFSATNMVQAAFPVEQQKTVQTTLTSDQTKSLPQLGSTQVQTQKEQVGEYTSPAAGGGKSQLIALILVILVGGLGIHRFYLGYTWQGVVQLLTAGGCGIWAIIDLIRIITGDLKPKNGEYTDKL